MDLIVFTWICQGCSMYFSPFVKENQTEVLQRLQHLLKLLFWTKGVQCWVKVLNASGPLCFWQCFYLRNTLRPCLDQSHLWNHDVQAHHRCRHDHDLHHHQQSVWKCNSPPGPFLCQMLAPSSPMKTNWGRRQIQIYQEEKSEKFKGKMDFKARGKPVLRILQVQAECCQIAFYSTPPLTITSRWPGSYLWSITIISSCHYLHQIQ